MGRGNVCVTGPHEGLYYIDNDYICVYHQSDPFIAEPAARLMADIDPDELKDFWTYDEWLTNEEEADILECFTDSFTKMFPSFSPPADRTWLRNGICGSPCRRVILENRLFYVAVEDNEWSLAVELIQREDPYDDRLYGLQGRHSKRYLEGIKKCLLERLPSIGTRTGAWTSGTITRKECPA